MSQSEATRDAIPADESNPAEDLSPEGPSSLADIEVKPMIRKAVEKHLREWPELMKRYAYQFAAYRGEERLEIGKSKHRLYRKYLDRGLSRDELVVLGIGPPEEDDPVGEELYDD